MFTINQGEETVRLLIGVVDSVTCGATPSINLLEFLWDTTLIFAFTKYGIVCFRLDSPKVLYFRHNGTASGCWTQNSLCRPCFGNYRHRVDPFLPEFTDSSSCRCHVCLRQPPSLRSLASYTVFHITNNLSEFTLSSEILYQQYVRALEFNIVRIDRLIPHSFPHLHCTFARAEGCRIVKRYHKACVDHSQFPCYTHTGEYFASKDKIIARFCTDKYEWWCDLCHKPLFATAECLLC